MWSRLWEVPLGQLSPGTYQVTYVVHQTTTMEFTVLESGVPVTIVAKPFRDTRRSSFTVQ